MYYTLKTENFRLCVFYHNIKDNKSTGNITNTKAAITKM